MNGRGLLTMLVLPGLVLLSACSSGAGSASPAIHVADVVHMGRYTQVFGSPLPSNQAQAAVVEGFREGEVLWNKAETARRLVTPVQEYVTGQALTHLDIVIKNAKKYDVVPAGADRLFMTRVTALSARSASVATCDDGSKFVQEDAKTGKVDASFLSSPGQDYLFETWRMVRLDGHWAISSFSLDNLPSRSAEPCQPGISGSGPSRWPSVASLLRQVRAVMRTVSSVHVSGTFSNGSKNLGLNLGMTSSGGYSGQISEDGAVLPVLVTHGQSYLKLSAAFLKVAHLPAAICNLYCGKYLDLPEAQAGSLFSGLTISSLTDSIASTTPSQVKLLGAVTLDSQPAWLLSGPHQGSAYVAAHGKPYILKVAATPGNGSLTLTQWNAVRLPAPPPASETVKPSQLGG